VIEQSSLELVFCESVILEYPIMSDSADQNWHHHWIVSKLIKIFLLEKIECEIVAFFNKVDGLFLGEFGWGLSGWLFHANSHIEKLHRYVWIHHQLLLTSLKHLW
jgi:hypothetical protein